MKKNKEKKKWSKKKKIILYPIISFFVIIALLSACTAAGLLSVESDVTDTTRQKRYIEVFDEIFTKKKKATIKEKLKAKDFSKFTELEGKRADKDGYTVKMETKKLKDASGNTYKANVEFWINKNMKTYAVDGATYKLIKPAAAKTEQKSKKAKTKSADEWNSKTAAVTDANRIATYETVFKEELDNAVPDLKYPLDYGKFEMTEKKYTYKNKNGYMVSVLCSKIRSKTDSDYHTGRIVFWINKDAMDDMSDYKIKLLEFDGENLIDDQTPEKASSDVDNDGKKSDYEDEANRAVQKVEEEAAAAGFYLENLDVEANGANKNGKTFPAVDVVLTAGTDDKTTAEQQGEKLKKIVLKHVKYGSVTVQKYKIDYQWDNYN